MRLWAYYQLAQECLRRECGTASTADAAIPTAASRQAAGAVATAS